MDNASARRATALVLAASAVVFLVVGLYVILATEYALVGGVLMATGAADAIVGVVLLGRA